MIGLWLIQVAFGLIIQGGFRVCWERQRPGGQRMRRVKVKDQDELAKGPGDQEDPGTRGPKNQG